MHPTQGSFALFPLVAGAPRGPDGQIHSVYLITHVRIQVDSQYTFSSKDAFNNSRSAVGPEEVFIKCLFCRGQARWAHV